MMIMENSQPNNAQPTNSGSQNTAMGILAYLGPLVVISYLVAKNDLSVKFHIKQGLVLLVIEVVVWLLGMIVWPLWMLFSLINLVVLVLIIIGIVNVVQGKQKNLPLVGGYARYFNI